MKVKRTILPIFLDHGGCTFRCSFCNQKSLVGNVTEPKTQIENVLKSFSPSPRRPCAELAFYGGDFLSLPCDEIESLLEMANTFGGKDKISGYRCSVRPDSIDELSAKWLSDIGFATVEVGAQCFDDSVLKSVNRHHTAADIENAAKAIKSADLTLGLQLMYGLPGQGREVTQGSNERAAFCKPDFVRLFPTVVVKDSLLEKMFRENGYSPLTIEDALDILTDAAGYFLSKGIALAQIGLHPSEPLAKGETMVAGPFHPRFGEMVRQRVSDQNGSSSPKSVSRENREQPK